MRHSDLKTGVVFTTLIHYLFEQHLRLKITAQDKADLAEYLNRSALFVTNVVEMVRVEKVCLVLRSAVCPNLRRWVSTLGSRSPLDALTLRTTTYSCQHWVPQCR
jgi:hypothetical protein